MSRKRFHGLKKIKVRASWNKYNLYNLSRLRAPQTTNQTFFQQKWSAKSTTRAYHGEQIREKQWTRMFTPKFNAVIPMDHRYLAEFDGSELAAGRGSGLEVKLNPNEDPPKPPNPVPYMNMTFAPIERRLDMAVFRALFASSARQARQFVIHGKVKVNGKKMPYPGYLLNPGDMFQVEVDSVLFATGKAKDVGQRREGRVLHRKLRRKNVSLHKARAAMHEKQAASKAKVKVQLLEKVRKPLFQDALEERKKVRLDLEALTADVQKYLDNTRNKAVLAAKNKQRARLFKKKIKMVMNKSHRMPIEEFTQQRDELLIEWKLLTISGNPKQQRSRSEHLPRARVLAQQRIDSELDEKRKRAGVAGIKHVGVKREEVDKEKAFEELERFRSAIEKVRSNPSDPTKPYATPWKPRAYMSAFAFIPRYLEVNHTICSAVYLRHPVARPGIAEVPSPFAPDTQQLAFTWYLRRR